MMDEKIDDYAFEQCALISASAGTGKTYTITSLVLKLLLGSVTRPPLPLENILVVTFTNAAASDLKRKIRERIREARLVLFKLNSYVQEGHSLAEQKDRLKELSSDEYLEQLILEKLTESEGDLSVLKLCYRVLLHAERSIDRAPICTIHAFCNRALNQIYAFEAGQAFDTELSEDLGEIFSEAEHSLNREIFYKPSEELHQLLKVLLEAKYFAGSETEQSIWKPVSTDFSPKSAKDQLSFKDIAAKLQEVRSGSAREAYLGYRIAGFTPKKASPKQLQALKAELYSVLRQYQENMAGFMPDWQERWQAYFADRSLSFDAFVTEDDQPGPAFGSKKCNFYSDLIPLFKSIRELLRNEQTAALSELIEQSSNLKTSYQKHNFISRKKEQELPDAELEAIAGLKQIFFEYVEELRSLVKRKQNLVDMLKLKLAILYLDRREQLCRRSGVMSNTDLLFKLNNVLDQQVKAGNQTLCNLLRQRYPVAMIDEFQDTDPLQLGIFEKLYLCQEAQQAQAVCCFIGDPKQSIYAFRGADINAYLYAQNLLNTIGGKVYHLSKNYRSAERLVAATNAIFSTELIPDNKPFGAGIEFDRVNAAHSSQELSFYFADTEQTAFDKPLFYVNELNTPEAMSRSALNPLQAKRCAQTVLHCLKSGRLCIKGEERAVRPSDLCILVSKSSEAQKMQEALAQQKVRSVFFSRKDSVLDSLSFREIIALLAAMCYPAESRLVIRLLSSPLLGYTPAEFVSKLQDEQLAAEMDLLNESQRIWQRHGFLGAFEHWFNAHQGLAKLLSCVDGERHVTDLYHLAEIVQTQHLKQRSLPAQLNWFIDYHREGNAEHLKRLESEVEQVKIYTEHSSKGLQFKVVLLPFICTTREKNEQELLLLHEGSASQISPVRTLVIRPNQNQRDLYFEEQTLEDMRLLYVALTRAEHALFIYPGDFSYHEGSQDLSSMAKLLRMLKPAVLTQMRSEYFKEECLPELNTLLPPSQEPESVQLGVAAFKKSFVNHRFKTTSFTALTSGLHEIKVNGPEGDDSSENVFDYLDGTEYLPKLGLSTFDFARGTQAGTFLHLLLERLQFEYLNTQELTAMSNSLKICEYTAFQRLLIRWCRDEQLALEGLKLWLSEIGHAPLYALDSQTVSLADLRAGDYLTEFDFTFPSLELNSAQFNAQVCIPQARDEVGEAAAAELTLNEQLISGYLTGQIDLFCALPAEHGRKYYVLDYKSTYLGNHYQDYNEDALRQSVFSPQNRYDVQFLIYTLAAHRYLSSRLADYDYERDFGGVIYLYVRALRSAGQSSPGVFFIKPKFEYLQKLDALCQGGGE